MKNLPPSPESRGESACEPTPGFYRHYKGGRYEVFFVAKHTESMEYLVVYRSLKEPSGYWVRPRQMFLETVEVEGKLVPRFSKESECD